MPDPLHDRRNEAASCECGHADHAHCEDGCGHEHDNPWQTRSLVAAALFNLLALAAQWTRLGGEGAVRGFSALSILLGGWFLLPSAWEALKRLRPNINLLMVLATVGGIVVGEWAEAATVVVLFGVAEWLEGWADRRARRAVGALLELAPEVATVLEGDRASERPVGEVPLDALVRVKNGDRVPLDGIVTRGNSSVNQAPITGESVPVDKRPGDAVFAGSINGEGSLEIRVSTRAGDTTLAKIIRLVEEAREQKAPMQRFVDVFARYYTPAVTILSLLTFVAPPLLLGADWSVWLYRACVLLIIACPCALVISTPIGIVAGLTALARRGVLVKGGAHLETIGKLKALALDKTGTLTEGKPRVLGVEVLNGDVRRILKIAASVDEHSSHPLARAIVGEARRLDLESIPSADFRALAGRGAEAVIDGSTFFVGNHRFAHESGVCSPQIEDRLGEIEARGQTAVVVGEKPGNGAAGGVLGIVAIGDSLRPGARDAVTSLRTAGLRHIVVLSGDNQRTVGAIAAEAGIEDARGDLLPEDKVAAVRELRERSRFVGMVGDGVNDAPAMAAASLGIAMGAGGTDAAIETSDVALMKDDLGAIAEAVRLGRRTLKIIRFNIGFALGLKALFLILAIAGISSLWLAILADTGATLLVVANSLRLLRTPPQRGKANEG